MSESKLNINLLMISGLIGIFLLALIFDLIIGGLVNRNAALGGIDTTLVWIFPLLQMLLMVALIGLLWLVVSTGGFSRFTCLVFLLVGLFLLYANPILYTNELPDSWYVVVQYLSPYSLLTQVGGAAAAFGLVTLFFWKGEKHIQDEGSDE
jgi:hypothetical protein